MENQNLQTAVSDWYYANWDAENVDNDNKKEAITAAFIAGAAWNETEKEVSRLVTEIERLDAQRVSERPKVTSDTLGLICNALIQFEALTGRPYEIKIP